MPPLREHPGRRLFVAAAVLGVALSGFFDGILLHQVLQWHHLLSLVEAEPLRDPRVQVMADGAFHVLMYAVAVAGLWALWRGRDGLANPGAGRAVAAGLIFGFGAWNVVDVGLFHWILRIHHIRLDRPNPLAWDLGWLVVLGLAPALVGWMMARKGGRGGGGTVLAGLAAFLALASGGGALRPVSQPFTLVLFRPDMSAGQVLGAVSAVDARVVAADRTGQLLVVALPDGRRGWSLYRLGALVVGGAGPAGCVSASRI